MNAPTPGTSDHLRWDRETVTLPPEWSLVRGSVRAAHHRHDQPGPTAFMLSGGGAQGALQVGALRALMEQGIYPDIVVGTSVGAWNGTAVARTPTLEGMRCLSALWQDAHAARVLLGRQRPTGSPLVLNAALLWDALRRMRNGCPSLCSDRGLRDLLTTHLGDASFDEMALPLVVTATDLTTGERTAFRSGRLIPTLLASSAIPGIFPPVWIGDRLYADGGALDSAGFTAAVALGAQRIFVLALGYDLAGIGAQRWDRARSLNAPSTVPVAPEAFVPPMPRERTARPSAAAVIERSTQVRHRVVLDLAVQQLPAHIETHIIPLSTGCGAGALDFTCVPQWIQRGYDLARAYLSDALPLRQRTMVAVEHGVGCADRISA